MLVDNISNKIDFIARSDLKLRSGDFVLLRVLKRLYGNKWAVGIKGRVISAYTKLDLTPGKLIRARVVAEGNRLILKLDNAFSDPVLEAAENIGLKPDALLQTIIESILRSNLPVVRRTVLAMRAKLGSVKSNRHKLARLMALLHDKGFDINGDTLDVFLELLGNSAYKGEDGYKRHEEEKGEEEGDETDKATEGLAKIIRKQLTMKTESPGSPLCLFNHLTGKHDNWIVLPYNVTYGNRSFSGTVRIKYDRYNGKILRFIIQMTTGKNEMYFYLEPRKNEETKRRYKMMIFSDDVRLSKKIYSKLDSLRLKLRNLGVEIDDTIFESDDFDGFSPLWEMPKYQVIDTTG